MLAITGFVVASIVVSCRGGIGEAERLDLSKTPTQRTFDVFGVQTDRGIVSMRLEALLMEHYDSDTASFDAFPDGISVFGYTPEGLLESVIVADDARHIMPGDKTKDEVWEAFGNVILHNVIEQETMETDTVYWDQAKKEIYTDCYVKIYSRQGFLQGFGMRSDDHVRNSILYRPFDGYGVVVQDSTAVIIDSVNFIGPFPKK